MEKRKSNFDNLKKKGDLDIYGNVIDWDTDGFTKENIDAPDIDVLEIIKKQSEKKQENNTNSQENV